MTRPVPPPPNDAARPAKPPAPAALREAAERFVARWHEQLDDMCECLNYAVSLGEVCPACALLAALREER